jgi:thioredoxin 2
MLIQCPSCNKLNRLSPEKVASKPICGSCQHDLLSTPIEANAGDFRELIRQTEIPVLVDFWAPWCGPCKMFAPTFAQLAKKYTNQVVFVKLNTEEEQSIAAQFGIRSIPTLAFFKGGKETNRLSGALGHGDLDHYIQQQLAT